ncbi:hypothetical protein DID80_08235, partial [Candidatus Marinamargulisbacteria bacterium SCGC AAA071-K20]
MVVDGSVSVNADLKIDKALLLKVGQVESTAIGEGQLFVDANGNLLFYRVGMSTPINLTGSYSGVSGHIPFYDTGGNISSDPSLLWDASAKTLKIGTANSQMLTRVEINASINETVVGSIAAQQINLNVGNRTSAGSSAIIKGLDVTMKSNPDVLSDAFNFGRIADGETAIGVYVDMTSLEAEYSDGSGGVYNGFKYAGLFRGGNVGIGTSAPNAALHVGPENEGTAFRVDTTYKLLGEDQTIVNALVVAATGNVGVGTATPQSQFSVITDTSTGLASSVFEISSGNSTLMIVQNDGKVGIGKNNPTALLDINGTVSANEGIFSGIQASTLNIGNGTLVITDAGEIGIGTVNTSGSLTFYKELNKLAIDPFTSQKVEMVVNGASGPSNPFHLDRDLTGLELIMKSLDDANDTLSGTQVATGVSINMSALSIGAGAKNAKVVGLDVNVGAGLGRYAAILLGGNVGIGTSNPTEELTVSGDIKATSIELTGDMLADRVTMNSLIVNSGITINGTIQVDTLIANTVSANNIEIIGRLEVSTASFEVITVNRLAKFNSVGIGVSQDDISEALIVSGNTKLYGNVEIIGTINVDVITSNTKITISPGGEGLIVNHAVSVNSDVKIDGALILKDGQSKVAENNRAQLFVDDDGDLVFYKGTGTTDVNLTGLFTGLPGRIPFYDTNGNISSDSLMSWENTTKVLKVGTADAKTLSTFEIVASINSTVAQNVSLQKIDLRFDRSMGSGTASKFKGLDIEFQSFPLQSADPFEFGRIAPGETAIGLNVDLTKLMASFSNESSAQDFNGNKYSAVFKGGNVGVGTLTPMAALHVQNAKDLPAFRVDAVYTDGVSDQTVENALFVSDTGLVGIGTNAPSAMLTLVPKNSSVALLDVNTSGKSYMYMNSGGNLGLGRVNPSYTLDVSGNFRIGNNAESDLLVVSANVGIGTSNTTAKLHVNGGMRVDTQSRSNALVVNSSTGYVGINDSNPGMSLTVGGLVETVRGTPISTFAKDTDRGFLARDAAEHAFFGLIQGEGTSFDTVVSWGASDT